MVNELIFWHMLEEIVFFFII